MRPIFLLLSFFPCCPPSLPPMARGYAPGQKSYCFISSHRPCNLAVASFLLVCRNRITALGELVVVTVEWSTRCQDWERQGEEKTPRRTRVTRRVSVCVQVGICHSNSFVSLSLSLSPPRHPLPHPPITLPVPCSCRRYMPTPPEPPLTVVGPVLVCSVKPVSLFPCRPVLLPARSGCALSCPAPCLPACQPGASVPHSQRFLTMSSTVHSKPTPPSTFTTFLLST